MAKALKAVAIVAGVAALAIVTGGAAAGLGLSLATTAFGVSASALLATSALASTAAGLLTKAPKVPTAQTDRLTASIDPRAFRKTVLGQTAFPIDVRYEEWSGTDQEYCDWIVALASHAIDGVEEIWLNTEMAWSQTTGVTAKYRGYFSIPNLVLEGSPANAFSFASGRWNGSARLTGCAYARLRFKVTGNSKKAESPFASGIPSRITIIGRGAKLYDPRRDSTVPGGSGPMRASDQSTWRFTTDDGAVIGENLPLHILRVALGWRIRNPVTGEMKLATGSGVPARRLNLGSWITAANLADEQVNRSAGGTEPRYHGAVVISEGDEPKTSLDAMCAACCARFRDTGGKLSIAISYNDLANAATDDGLSDDDVVGGFSWDPDPSLAATPNVIRGRYVDASTNSLYQLIDYPEVRLASPDGQDRIFPLDLGVVESASHAQRVAKQVLQRRQYQREFTAPFDIRAWKYTVGDVVPFTFAPLSFARALFRVKEQELGQGGTCNMTLTVEHPQIYAFDRDDAAPVLAAEPIVYDASRNPLILAIADAGNTATWTGVTGAAKPADNATNSADPTSPFGPGGTVSDAQRAIDAAKARLHELDTVTIPAIDAATTAAGNRITAARAIADKARDDLIAEIGRAQGAEGHLKERIDSIVAEGGYDDTAVYAAVDRVDRAAVGRDVAMGERIDNVKAGVDTVDSRIAASASDVTRAFTNGDIALGDRARALEAAAVAANGSVLNRNPNFSFWTNPAGLPDGWIWWVANGTVSRFQTANASGGYAFRHNCPGGVEAGIYSTPCRVQPGWYVFEADIELLDGSLYGAGLTLSGVYNLNFATEPDVNGDIGPGGFRRRRFSKLVKVEVTLDNWHPMTNWSGFGALSYKFVDWYYSAIRPATDGEIKAGKADAALNNPGGVLARLTDTANALADLPNRYAAVQRTADLEAQVNFAADSGLQRTINARIEDRATVIADSKVGPVAATQQTLRTEYNGTKQEVIDQRGVIAGLNGKTAAYVRLIADAGNGRASLSLWSDQFGGAWQLDGNGLINGNLTVNGTVTARAFNGPSMIREASASWTGIIAPDPGQSITVPWSLGLPAIPPQGRFIYEYTAAVSSNAGQSQYGGVDGQGRPITTIYLADGGVALFATDAQGNRYYPVLNGSQRVIATTDFAPTFTATVSRGNAYRWEEHSDFVREYISATYTLTSLALKVTWVAI